MQGRNLIALVVGVCVLSAAIGSGITLLAKEGPQGSPGPRGATGARGPRGFEAEEVAGINAQGEVEDVQSQAYELEEHVENLENEVLYLEDEINSVENQTEGMCLSLPPELGVSC